MVLPHPVRGNQSAASSTKQTGGIPELLSKWRNRTGRTDRAHFKRPNSVKQARGNVSRNLLTWRKCIQNKSPENNKYMSRYIFMVPYV